MLKNPNNKIAVFHNLPSGGAKRVLNEFEVCLKKKYQVKTFTTPNVKFVNFFHYLFYVFIELPHIHSEIAKKIDNKNYNLVMVHHDFLTKSPYILKYLKTKTFYLCHEEPREFYSDKNFLSSNLKYKLINFIRYPLKLIDKKNVKSTNYAITNSKFSQKKLGIIYSKKFSRIQLGVDSNRFKLLKLEKRNFFLTVGSTSKFKGIDFLVKTISLLPAKYKYPLVIIGSEGRDNKEIIDLAKKLGVKIVQKRNVSDDELIKYYNTATLLLAAGINEPFGLSIIEALSCGLQIIAVNEGGYSEIIKSNELGLLVDRDENKFMKAIIERINHTPNKIFLHEYVEKNWNWDTTMKQLHTIFRQPLR